MYNEPPSNYGYGAAPQPPAWAPLGRVTPDGRPLAEPWQRLLAAILDNIILGIVTTAITFPLWKDFVSAYLRWIGDLVEDPTAPEPELAEVTAMVQDTLGPNIIWITPHHAGDFVGLPDLLPGPFRRDARQDGPADSGPSRRPAWAAHGR